MKAVGFWCIFMAVMTFQKEVQHRFGIWFWAQHEKALECDFKKVSCWSLGQKVKGMGSVRWSWENLKNEVFNGHFEF